MPDVNTNPVQRLRDALEPLARTSPILAALASSSPDELPTLITHFADEAGHRRQIDRPLLADLFHVRFTPPTLPANASLDLRLWCAVHDASIDPMALVAPQGQPLIGLGTPLVIETASQTELGALHALWTIAQRRGDSVIRERCMDAAEYLIAEVQPDNATNHPFALAAFLALAHAGNFEAMLYAQTLLHNCQVQLGRPDAFSAALLLHAARCP
jgi:hypothetical protein